MFKLNYKNIFKKKSVIDEAADELIKGNIDQLVSMEEFEKMFPLVGDLYFQDYWNGLNKTLNEYGIISRDNIAKFCAQVGHESGCLRFREENLNYSSEALLRVFGKYFDIGTAKTFAYKPEKIANRVYANRMGNGDEESGDGWKYRGRGFIQLTGYNNYGEYGRFKYMNVNDTIEYIETIEGAWDVSGWYFWHNGIISSDLKTQTKIINGGYNGLKDRQELYEEYKKILGVK